MPVGESHLDMRSIAEFVGVHSIRCPVPRYDGARSRSAKPSMPATLPTGATCSLANFALKWGLVPDWCPSRSSEGGVACIDQATLDSSLHVGTAIWYRLKLRIISP
jgi:hypothetical protein